MSVANEAVDVGPGDRCAEAGSMHNLITRAVIATLDERRLWFASIPALCRIANVSERRLQIAFNEEFGRPPSSFLRRRALESVRRHLERSDVDSTTVTRVAQDHGFTHLGRFSQYYRDEFDELPSETLRRAAAVRSSTLVSAGRAHTCRSAVRRCRVDVQ